MRFGESPNNVMDRDILYHHIIQKKVSKACMGVLFRTVTEFCEREKYEAKGAKLLLDKVKRDVTKYIKKVFIKLYYTCWNSC